MEIEKVKRYWDKRPCNIKHSNKCIGTKDYFEEVTKKKYIVESHILEFANFENYKNKNVLEVGCGIGTAAHSFIENGANYTGLDISEKSILLAQTRLRKFDLHGHIFYGDIEKITSGIRNYCFMPDSYDYSFDPNTVPDQFDLIYSFGVLHHTPNIKVAIKNIYNMLKPRGEFKLMLYAKNSWKYAMIKEGLDQYEAQSGVPIANTYTQDEVKELLKDFKYVIINQTHLFPYKINKYKNGEYVKHDYFESMPPELFSCLEKHFGWHLCITCVK